MNAAPGHEDPTDEPAETPAPRPADGPAGNPDHSAADGPVRSADLVVAFVPGVMPGKWFFRWRDRNPGRALAERPLEADTWRDELGQGRAHACFVRLPAHPRAGVDDLAALRRDFRAVELYGEQQVVVLPRDHELTLLDEVPVAELVDEVLLQEPASLPERQQLRSPEAVAADAPLPPVRHARDAIELVAAGLGLVVVPMSVARLHHRKDLVHRVVPDAATVPVALVWPQDLPEEQEELVQDFVGVVRGRGLNSSRGTGTGGPAAEPAVDRRPAKGAQGARASSSSGRAARPAAGGRRGPGGGRAGRGKAAGRSKGRGRR
ncbi:LysR family transcriptional regulator substrate-binding protein [Kocuria rosea]|uniref:LysR family transcriptional regulator substrate-binding protein n=1 Tax=Kocuria rosea TaxID=1275 RepID=UPI0020425E40|nr:LysR family transcriptional regulator substrate-binding protein [Kocuria rosea]MCM3689295.1 LysR family transcriptional regulator substrate-binding protein [Kocuria rosea]